MNTRIKNRLPELMGKKRIKSILFLSSELDVPYSTLRNFYHERHEIINAELIKKICLYFDIEIGELFYLEVDGQVS
ncbi:helix-turn-helix domain-containing protein [Priestia flexa]|uniref:helix-turn-helix domain-containing protein n=1 Tax=Priestia flexa TaxID=86664 RepID=UPI000473DD56|nr:helix-turn-helix transcriptional regulator [Priestia flexa]